VAIACGSTREAVCPACALKARVLRMQQCAAGRSRMDEPTGKPRADLPTVSGLMVQICTKSPPGAVEPAPRRRRLLARTSIPAVLGSGPLFVANHAVISAPSSWGRRFRRERVEHR